jgi:hypothetical protein
MKLTLPLLISTLALSPACTDSDPTPAEKAETAFWTAMNGPSYDQSQAVSDQLAAVVAKDSKDSRSLELYGAVNLWRAAEAGRAGSGAPQIAMQSAPIAYQAMGGALQAEPDNAFRTGFFGIMQIDADPTSEMGVAQGEGLIAQATGEQPTFGSVLQLVSRELELPASSPHFQGAVASAWQWFDTCYPGIDHTNPTLQPYLGKVVTTGWGRFCWETERAPHALHAILLRMGDALTKQNQLGAAAVMYQNVQLLEDHPILAGNTPWPYDSVAADRLAHLQDRAASYADPDPTKWAPVGYPPPYSCSVCHGRSGQ